MYQRLKVSFWWLMSWTFGGSSRYIGLSERAPRVVDPCTLLLPPPSSMDDLIVWHWGSQGQTECHLLDNSSVYLGASVSSAVGVNR